MKTNEIYQRRSARLAFIALSAVLLFGVSPALAGPLIGAAQNFAVLEKITLTGAVRQKDSAAQQAQSDATLEFNTLAGLPLTSDLAGRQHGTADALPPGTLTHDFGIKPEQLIWFQIGRSPAATSGSSVIVMNDGSNSPVYWDIGNSAARGMSMPFDGNILAGLSIPLDSTASILCGRPIALDAAISMDENSISNKCSNVANSASGRSDFGSFSLIGSIGAIAASGPAPLVALVFIGGVISLTGFMRGNRLEELVSDAI